MRAWREPVREFSLAWIQVLCLDPREELCGPVRWETDEMEVLRDLPVGPGAIHDTSVHSPQRLLVHLDLLLDDDFGTELHGCLI